MKILAFCPYYSPHLGGLERYAEELHDNLIKKGHEVTVFTSDIPNIPQNELPSHIKIIQFPAWEIIFNFPVPKIWLPSFWKLVSHLYRQKFDIVFSVTRFFLTSGMAGIWAKTKHIPWIHIEHGSDHVASNNIAIHTFSRIYDATIGSIIFKSSNINIAPSKSAQTFINRYDNRPTPVIYRGMPYEQIDAIPANQTTYPQKTVITYCGRFIDGKGLPDLIQALAKTENKNFILLMAGKGPMKKKLKTLLQKHNLTEQTKFLGQLPYKKMIGVIKASDIIINPSYNEGLPTVILEAAACNTAIIATNVGGTTEIIDNESAKIVQAGNIEELTNAINELATTPEQRLKLSNNASELIKKRFDWKKATSSYISIMETLKKKP